jgi:integrase
MDVSLVNVPEWLAIKKNTGHQGRPSIGFSDVREGSLNHLLILWFDAAKSSEGKEGALLAPRTLDGYVSTAKTHLIRQLGNMPAVDLTRDQIEDLLDDVKKESRKKIAASAQGENQKVGCAAMVRHILKVISGAYEYARSNVKEFRRIDNPARGIRVRVPKGRRDRCLMDRELATLLPCLDSLSDPMAADIYRIMLYSGCRTGAACEIDSSNIVEHNGEMVWESRHKTDRQHRVPLIGEIGEIINRRLIAVGNKGPLFWHVKPGTRYPAQLKKANKELKKLTAGKIAPFIPYDFRHTMRSNLASLGVRGEVAELALGHAQKGMVQVYQHYDFWKERKAALTLWHEKLQSLIAREEAKAA